jgi:hypothetical protein
LLNNWIFITQALSAIDEVGDIAHVKYNKGKNKNLENEVIEYWRNQDSKHLWPSRPQNFLYQILCIIHCPNEKKYKQWFLSKLFNWLPHILCNFIFFFNIALRLLMYRGSLHVCRLDFWHWIKPIRGKIFNVEVGTSLPWCLSSAPEQEVRDKNKAELLFLISFTFYKK